MHTAHYPTIVVGCTGVHRNGCASILYQRIGCPVWNQLNVRFAVLPGAIYLNGSDRLQPIHWWNTRLGVLNGKIRQLYFSPSLSILVLYRLVSETDLCITGTGETQPALRSAADR